MAPNLASVSGYILGGVRGVACGLSRPHAILEPARGRPLPLGFSPFRVNTRLTRLHDPKSCIRLWIYFGGGCAGPLAAPRRPGGPPCINVSLGRQSDGIYWRSLHLWFRPPHAGHTQHALRFYEATKPYFPFYRHPKPYSSRYSHGLNRFLYDRVEMDFGGLFPV